MKEGKGREDEEKEMVVGNRICDLKTQTRVEMY